MQNSAQNPHFRDKLFHPVIIFPKDYVVLDLTENYDPEFLSHIPYSIGKFNEVRGTIYTAEIFNKNGVKRIVHMGIDLGAPVGTEVYAFDDGEILFCGNNAAPGDYGYTMIAKQKLFGDEVYVLYGHLSRASIEGKKSGQRFCKGDVIAWLGSDQENGGWNPHLHFQIGRVRPDQCDMPGVVSIEERARALKQYIDPRVVLGPLY